MMNIRSQLRISSLLRTRSLLFTLAPATAFATPFCGTATEMEFCVSQPQFCDINETNPAGGVFDLALTVPTQPLTDATFTLTAYGDFEDGPTETFAVFVEGFAQGFFLNSKPEDDLFDNAGFGDRGNDFIRPLVATATIPLAYLTEIVADGSFVVTFDSSTGINDIQSQVSETIPNQDFREFISYQLSFDAGEVVSALPGDFNGDGTVSDSDLTKWKIGFGMDGSATPLDGDADGDLDVDGADLLFWQRQLGASTASSLKSAVPEPASAILILATALGCSHLRGRTAFTAASNNYR